LLLKENVDNYVSANDAFLDTLNVNRLKSPNKQKQKWEQKKPKGSKKESKNRPKLHMTEGGEP
jgi:hypothetical protein